MNNLRVNLLLLELTEALLYTRIYKTIGIISEFFKLKFLTEPHQYIYISV